MGIIQSEEQTKDSGLFQSAIPKADSNAAILLDVFGVFRSITLNGTFKGSITEQNTFITSIETICSGSQISSTFVSSIRTSPLKVFIQTFNWEVVEANTNYIKYTLTLLEGREITS